MASPTANTRHLRIRWLSGVSCVLLLVVLLFANGILARASMRIDLTDEGLYTLSDGSKKILGEIEDPARIQVFWHNVPLRFDLTKRYVAALLEEMESASDGKVQSQWVDMSEDAGIEQATELGLEEHTFSVRHGAEFRQAQGYMSLVIEMGDAEPEKINALANITDKLEYRIVSSIFKAQRAAPPIIGLVQHIPFNPMAGGRPQSRFAFLAHELQLAFGSALRSYITLDQPVPEDIDVLIVCDPRDFDEKQVYRFEQFLLRGGRAILLLDPLDAQGVLGRGVQVVRTSSSGFEDWLGHIGITVEKGCVVDFHEEASCLFPVELRDRMGRTIGVEYRRYAHWPKITPENIDSTNPVMRYLRPMATYWPAALSIDTKKQTDAGRSVQVLATTSDQGHRRSDVTNVRQPGFSPQGKVTEKVPLIALVEGPLDSFWKGKRDPTLPPPPEPKKDDEEPKDGDDPDGTEPKDGDGKAPEGDDGVGSPDGDAPDAPKAPEKDAPKAPKAPEKDAPKAPEKDAPKAPEKDAPKEPKKDDPKEPKKDEPKEPKKDDGGDGGDGGNGDEDGKADDEDEPSDDEKSDDEKSDDEKSEDEKGEEAPAGPERFDNGSVRFVVMGDADLVSDVFQPTARGFLTMINGAGGFAFIHNMADWLSGSEDLMALRSRATNPRNLTQLEDEDLKAIKYLNLLLVPLLVLLAGLTVFIVRRS